MEGEKWHAHNAFLSCTFEMNGGVHREADIRRALLWMSPQKRIWEAKEDESKNAQSKWTLKLMRENEDDAEFRHD